MPDDSTTAVRSDSFGNALRALAWSFIGWHPPEPCSRDAGGPGRAPGLGAALAGIVVLILRLLAVVAMLIFYLPAALHLVVK